MVSGDQTSKKHGELFNFSSLKGIASFVKILIVSGGKSSELYLHGKSVRPARNHRREIAAVSNRDVITAVG